ncbi:MAG: MBL fold metallo-hydrolase [Pseudohongiellaceae bacterium]
MTDRRTLLKYSLGGMALSMLPAGLLAQLGSNLMLVQAGGANQLAMTTTAGLVLVDSGPAAATTELVSALGETPVSTLFNTHWHADQVGNNAVFGSQGARIIAHQKTRQRLATRYYLPHENRYHDTLPQAAWPTQIFHDKGVLESGGETIEYGWLVQPHTDGDIYVYFRDANVLAAGDAVSPLKDPALDWYGGGWLGGRVNSLDFLLDITDADTRIVPAYGPVMSQADLLAERDLMQEVYNRLLDLIRQGCSASCMQQEGALDGLPRTWRDPQTFLYAAYKGMWAHHYNLAPNIL